MSKLHSISQIHLRGWTNVKKYADCFSNIDSCLHKNSKQIMLAAQKLFWHPTYLHLVLLTFQKNFKVLIIIYVVVVRVAANMGICCHIIKTWEVFYIEMYVPSLWTTIDINAIYMSICICTTDYHYHMTIKSLSLVSQLALNIELPESVYIFY